MKAGDETLFPADGYQDLRAALIAYLRRRRSKTAEDLADETIVRVLEKLKAGAKLKNLRAFAFRVARHVHLEDIREPQIVALSDDFVSERVSDKAEALDRCLCQCRKRLSPYDRKIINEYYSGNGREQINNRRKLAAELGLTMDALRIQTHRIRKGLESCIEECMLRHIRT